MSYWQQLNSGIVSYYCKTLRNIENGTAACIHLSSYLQVVYTTINFVIYSWFIHFSIVQAIAPLQRALEL